MKRVWLVVIAVAVLAAVGGGAFWGGIQFGENRIAQDPSRLFSQLGGAGGRGGQFPAGGVGEGGAMPASGQQGPGGTGERADGGTRGTIEAVEEGALVIGTDGGSVRVLVSETTMVEKYVSVTVDELEVGEQIMVAGSTNDDGSITARSIQSLRALPEDAASEQ